MPPITIYLTPMADDDIDRVMDAEARIFPSVWPRSMYEDLLDRPGSDCRIAHTSTGQMVGFYITDQPDDFTCHIYIIGTVSTFQRRGVATKMLTHIINSRSPLVSDITLQVRQSNTAARALYNKHGFRVTSFISKYYPVPKEEGAYVMTLTVAPNEQAARAAAEFDLSLMRVYPNPIAIATVMMVHNPTGDWISWEPTAAYDTLISAGVPPSEQAENMIGALMAALMQPGRVMREVWVLENVLTALNGLVPDMGISAPPSACEAHYALNVLHRLGCPVMNDDGPRGYPIRAYIETLIHNYGISFGVDACASVTDRTATPLRIGQVRNRLQEYRAQSRKTGQIEVLKETPIDVEVGKIDAIYAYMAMQRPYEPLLRTDLVATLGKRVQARLS